MSARPNIILINCDDLGYGDLGCYGSAVNDTPHIDRLAAEGTRFTQFYMASALCTPSRGAMLTGCYPGRISFDVFEDGKWVLFPGSPIGLHQDERTVAQLLQEAGYATQLVGKWHCGDQPEFLPTERGFDHYYGLPYSNDMGRQANRADYPPLPLLRDGEVVQEQPDQAALTERYVEESVRFLRANQERPFFLYFAHMYVHLPLIVPERFAKHSRNGNYGAAVAAIDWATGALMAELDRLGLRENTLVLFTSDNGSRVRGEGGSNGPLRGTKAQTWEGGVRLPLIARWPERVPAGRVCDELCASIDFLPTLATLADTAMPERAIDGHDCSELLCGGATGPRDDFFYYFKDHLDAVRDRRYKLIVGRRDPQGRDATAGHLQVCELYDLLEDPGETTDISAQHPAVVEALQQRLQAMREELGDASTGVRGRARRPAGVCTAPQPLTTFDPAHPYFAAEYDTHEAG